MRTILILLLCSIVLLHGAESQAQDETLNILVVLSFDKGTRKPVPNCRVKVEGENGDKIIYETDANGESKIGSCEGLSCFVPGVLYKITVSKRGYRKAVDTILPEGLDGETKTLFIKEFYIEKKRCKKAEIMISRQLGWLR